MINEIWAFLAAGINAVWEVFFILFNSIGAGVLYLSVFFIIAVYRFLLSPLLGRSVPGGSLLHELGSDKAKKNKKSNED